MKVQKRDGSFEDLSPEKLNNSVMWACKDLQNTNPSDIVMNAKIQMFDGIKTTKIHEALISSAMNMIQLRTPNYQYVAARLLSFYTRKQLFGVYLDEDMPKIEDIIKLNIDKGYYDESILSKFTKSQFIELNAAINHANDDKLTFAAYRKMLDSYVTRDRKTGYLYETPQYTFMMIAMSAFDDVPEIVAYYEDFVEKRTSLPTPPMAGLRTKSKQFASCVLIDIGDDLESIYASMHAIGRFVSRKAGIGANYGRIRPVGSSIRGGEVTHTGVIPFLKLGQASTKSCCLTPDTWVEILDE
jgi:ribonucleoside-diphosphate reductase alpha chain